MRIAPPSVRWSSSAVPASSPAGSIVLGSSGCLRAKASRRSVSSAASRPVSRASSISVRRSSCGGVSASSSSRSIDSTASRLLKSCATPPVSWPIASIFWTWCSSAWADCRSVTSSATPLHTTAPSSRRAGRAIRCIQRSAPSSPRTRIWWSSGARPDAEASSAARQPSRSAAWIARASVSGRARSDSGSSAKTRRSPSLT